MASIDWYPAAPLWTQYLRDQEFRLSLGDDLRIATLVERLRQRGATIPDATTAARLFGPIVCQNADDQRRLPDLLEKWAELRWAPQQHRGEYKVQRNEYQDVFVFILFAIFMLVPYIFLYFHNPPEFLHQLRGKLADDVAVLAVTVTAVVYVRRFFYILLGIALVGSILIIGNLIGEVTVLRLGQFFQCTFQVPAWPKVLMQILPARFTSTISRQIRRDHP